jgi:hypothetical protein
MVKLVILLIINRLMDRFVINRHITAANIIIYDSRANLNHFLDKFAAPETKPRHLQIE